MGQPIDVLIDPNADFEDLVDTAHRNYFGALKDMFKRNQTAAGYPDHRLVFIDETSGRTEGKHARRHASEDSISSRSRKKTG